MNWSYVTGFFDADGSIFIRGNKRVGLSFTNGHLETLTRIRKFLKLEHLKIRAHFPTKGTKTAYLLAVGDHERVLAIAKKMIKYSVTKKHRLLEVISHIKNKKWRKHGTLKRLSREKLYNLYINKKLTIYDIAEMFSVVPQAIHNKLVKLGIPRRKSGPRPKNLAG